MPIKKYFECPECGEKIDHVYYSCWTSGKESGKAYIEKSKYGDIDFINHECDDSETDDSGDYEYTCPECDHTLSENDLKNQENDDENDNIEKNEDGEPLKEIEEIDENLIANKNYSFDNESIIVCPKCNYQNIMEKDEKTCVCTNCDMIIKRKTDGFLYTITYLTNN